MRGSYNPYGQLPWNFNQGFFELVHNRLDDQAKFALVGNIGGWFRTSRLLFVMMYPKLQKKNKTELIKQIEEKLEEIDKELYTQSNALTEHIRAQQQSFKFGKIEKKLYELDKILYTEAFALGWILPKPKRLDVDDKIENDYSSE